MKPLITTTILILALTLLFLRYQFVVVGLNDEIEQLKKEVRTQSIMKHDCLNDLVRCRMGGEWPHE